MFDTWSRLVVHVAMDNTVVIEEISEYKQLKVKRENRITLRDSLDNTQLGISGRPCKRFQVAK